GLESGCGRWTDEGLRAQPVRYRRPGGVPGLLAPVGPRGRPARRARAGPGRFRESEAGGITPRQVLILVEWESRAAFESYRQDPPLADLHPHREAGTSAYVWHLFDRLDDLRPLLRP